MGNLYKRGLYVTTYGLNNEKKVGIAKDDFFFFCFFLFLLSSFKNRLLVVRDRLLICNRHVPAENVRLSKQSIDVDNCLLAKAKLGQNVVGSRECPKYRFLRKLLWGEIQKSEMKKNYFGTLFCINAVIESFR